MTYFILIASVVCAWAMLRVLGGERERQLQLAQLRAIPKPAPAALPIARSATFTKLPAGPIAPQKPTAAPAAAPVPLKPAAATKQANAPAAKPGK